MGSYRLSSLGELLSGRVFVSVNRLVCVFLVGYDWVEAIGWRVHEVAGEGSGMGGVWGGGMP